MGPVERELREHASDDQDWFVDYSSSEAWNLLFSASLALGVRSTMMFTPLWPDILSEAIECAHELEKAGRL